MVYSGTIIIHLFPTYGNTQNKNNDTPFTFKSKRPDPQRTCRRIHMRP